MTQSSDPAVAALMVEIKYLREAVQKMETKMDTELGVLKASVSEINAIVTKVRGGYFTLALIGGMLVWFLGAWDKLAKLWN